MGDAQSASFTDNKQLRSQASGGGGKERERERGRRGGWPGDKDVMCGGLGVNALMTECV